LEPATGDGAIIVYPEGIDGGWDLDAEGVDVQFFDAMLASLTEDYCIDQARIFSTGYSFGGMMSHTLACSRGSQLRAFAPMARAFFGGLPPDGRCATPVPGWIAHATNDDLVGFSSGETARDVWIETNGGDTTTTPVDPSPCVAYQCSEAALQWCAHTQGHEWPNIASEAVWEFFQSQ
jgi:polyhydroxybutyrate depolymerase